MSLVFVQHSQRGGVGTDKRGCWPSGRESGPVQCVCGDLEVVQVLEEVWLGQLSCCTTQSAYKGGGAVRRASASHWGLVLYN